MSLFHQARSATTTPLHCRTCNDRRAVVRADGDHARAARCPDCSAVCPKCGGVGYLFAEDDTGNVVAQRCSCTTLDARIDAYNRAGIPRLYADATIEGFRELGNPALREAKVRMLAMSTRYEPGQPGPGLSGPVGSGKTHLAAALVGALTLERGVDARFVEFTHLLARIRAGYDEGRGEATVLGGFVDAEVLIIDELGKGLTTEWQVAILDELISRRYNRGLTTGFTTNYPFEVATSRGGGRSRENFAATSLEARVGARMYSRLAAMCDFVRIEADDYRRRSRGHS